MSRGRSPGYGLYFSKTRIIGVRKRRVSFVFGLVFGVPLLALLLYLDFTLRFSGPYYAVFLLPFLPAIAELGVRRLRHTVPEKIMRKSNPTTTSELGPRLDFELRREEISQLLMKHISGGMLLREPGYLRITLRDHSQKPIEIKIHEIKQLRELRELVIEFAAGTPQVRAVEW